MSCRMAYGTNAKVAVSPFMERNFKRTCGFAPIVIIITALPATQRAAVLFDPEPAAEEMFGEVRPTDFLKFTDDKSYGERLKEAQKENARREAVISFCGHIKGIQVAAAIFDFTFMGGSMGSVAGERFVRIVDEARGRGLPFVSFAASGGARMQEGVMALVQMAKNQRCFVKIGAIASSPYQRLNRPHNRRRGG